MAFTIDFAEQLRQPWEGAGGFLVDQLQLLHAQLAPIFPLIAGLQATTTTNPLLGLSGYPASSILVTDATSAPSFSQALPGPLAFAGGTVLSPAALTVNVNDYTPSGLTAASVVRLSATGAVNITGLKAPSVAGFKLVVNTSAFTLTLTHADVASAAANRWRCPGAVNLALTTSMAVWIWYDATSTVWQVVT